MQRLRVLEQHLGVTFRDKQLLLQAVTHRSYLNENRDWPVGHNERLEFLGDTVLNMVITEALFRGFPDTPEGQLTTLRSQLVSTVVFSQVGQELGIPQFLFMSNGQKKDTRRAQEYLTACALEAIVGAIYLDQGLATARLFIGRTVLPQVREVQKGRHRFDPKGVLQERAQELLRLTPTYRTITVSGPEHNRQFVCGVYFNEACIATGSGRSKKAGEMEAAKAALVKQGWTS